MADRHCDASHLSGFDYTVTRYETLGFSGQFNQRISHAEISPKYIS
ncbi:MAG TPA: hypothetical protein PK918_01105 [Methanotrichaceae archaeon]|nr:hypothetical protein [Methanotrichaceae archaeon]